MFEYYARILFLILAPIMYSGMVLILASSCGGYDQCSNKFCISGLMEKYGIYTILLLIIIEIIIVITTKLI